MGGRHGYGTTFATLQSGLAIDLSKLTNVTIDKTAATVTMGGAAQVRDVINSVHEAGFQIGGFPTSFHRIYIIDNVL
jgi:FAD/FMN-containing dehydrogenase